MIKIRLEEIKSELKKDGYFIYLENKKRTLAMKEGNDFKLFEENIKTYDADRPYETPLTALRQQVNNQLLGDLNYVDDLATVIPIIDFSVFANYDKRNAEIKKHQKLLNDIMESKSVFGRKKYRLVYFDSFGKHYYLIKDNQTFPADAEMFDKSELDNAFEVDSITVVSKALQDTFKNEYSEKYQQEVEKWNSI